MLTVIITTFNRSQYLERLLRYFKKCDLEFKIFIADASEESSLEKNKEIVTKYSKSLNIDHHIWQCSCDTYEAMFWSLEKVTTKYVVLTAEDDFLIPKGLNCGVEFLENNPSYISVQGKQLGFQTTNDGAYSSVESILDLNMVDASVEDLISRIKTPEKPPNHKVIMGEMIVRGSSRNFS